MQRNSLNITTFTCLAIFAFCAFHLLGIEGYSLMQTGDVIIRYNSTTFICDQTVCPNNTVTCRVVKTNDTEDEKFIERSNYCIAENGDTLLKYSTREEADPENDNEVNITMSKNGPTEAAKYKEEQKKMMKSLREQFLKTFNGFGF